MWMPRDPDVLGQPVSPTASSASRADEGHLAHLRPRHAGHRVEVDPQLVGVVQVLGADRVRVEVEAAEVRDPREAGRLVEHDLVGGPARREGERGRPDPVGRVVRGALLEERLLLGPVDEPLERHRAAADPGQRAVGDREEVPHQVELGVPGLGEVHLVGVADRDLAVADLEDLLPCRHATMLEERGKRARGAPSHPGDARAMVDRYRPGRSSPSRDREPRVVHGPTRE